MPVPIRNMPFSFGTKLMLTFGNYELPERILCDLVLEKGMNVIEMGTSIGILAGIISHKIGSKGKLITIEASPKKIKIASSWLLNHYPNIKILNGYCFPCTNIPKNIVVKKFHESTAMLGGEIEYEIKKKNKAPNNSTLIFDINKIEKEYLLDHADLLVADVEGAEDILLLEDISFPKTLKHIVIETHPEKYKNKEDLKDIISKIQENDLTLIHKIENSYLFSRSK